MVLTEQLVTDTLRLHWLLATLVIDVLTFLALLAGRTNGFNGSKQCLKLFHFVVGRKKN